MSGQSEVQTGSRKVRAIVLPRRLGERHGLPVLVDQTEGGRRGV